MKCIVNNHSQQLHALELLTTKVLSVTKVIYWMVHLWKDLHFLK